MTADSTVTVTPVHFLLLSGTLLLNMLNIVIVFVGFGSG